MLETLTANTSIDFSASNAYSIVIWAIKNANKYFDQQLVKLYRDLSSRENVQLYKSNSHHIEDGWRYQKDEMSHYSLDYRIVDHHYDAISTEFGSERGMGPLARTRIEDILTVAANLGLTVNEKEYEFEWLPGRKNHFHMSVDGESETFATIKAYKHGNLHYAFSKRFMRALNIEAARLNGWIKSPKEACAEFDISLEEAETMFGSSLRLGSSDLRTLLPYHVDKNDKRNDAAPAPSNSEDYSPEQQEVFGNGTLF
jgi:hypothetical protein